jgi:hypothetical protein
LLHLLRPPKRPAGAQVSKVEEIKAGLWGILNEAAPSKAEIEEGEEEEIQFCSPTRNLHGGDVADLRQLCMLACSD